MWGNEIMRGGAMVVNPEVLGGLLERVGEERIDGPLNFSINNHTAFVVKGLRVERSVRFNRFFHNLKHVTLDTKIVRIWKLRGPDAFVTAERIFRLFPDPAIRFVEPGHVREILSCHARTGSLLNEGNEGNVFCAQDSAHRPRSVLLNRMAPRVWALGTPDALGDPLNAEYRFGAIVLTY